MSSTSDAGLSEFVQLSTMLLQLLDSEHDLSSSADSLPRSTSSQALDTSRPLTLVDSQGERTPSEIKPQESRIQAIPTIILITPSGQEMDIDTAPEWRNVQLPAHLAYLLSRDKRSPQADSNTDGDANDDANGNPNDGKEKSTASQSVVTERTTDQDPSRVSRTVKKIRRKFRGVYRRQVGGIEARSAKG
ncbi:hypothetical protein V8C34DRAFT_59205 [Trichoderma compactum]